MGMADYILKTNFSSSSKPLSSSQMGSLTAICDTLLPSITNPHHHHPGGDLLSFSFSSADGRRRMDTATTTFYKTSASMAAIPQYIGEVMKDKFKHPSLWIVRIALWMLSTWYGTFIMCGTRSLKNQFPYFQRFSKVSLEKREEILIGWSLSYFYLLRMLFHGIKFLTLLFYFSQVDEKNENPSWTALGYCGPDPQFINLNTETTTEEDRNHHENNQENNLFGPLYRGLHPRADSKHIFAQSLRKSGFPVTIRGNQSSPSLSIQCDAVVVGSGSGGGVVAGVLAKAGYKVIVLEKGDYFARSTLSLLEGPTIDKMYQGSGLLPTEDLGVIVLAGSTVGGGSTINWSASIKTPEHVLKEWSNNYELELFESKLYKDAMDVVCERMGVQSCFHEEGFNNAVLRRGCVKLGYPVDNIPRNSSPDHYCGWCNFGCKDGRKKGTSETWLVDMVESGNGLIMPKCEAKKILLKKKHGRSTAIGVAFEFDNGSQVKEVYMVESKVTIVAGGALGTPVLLKEGGLKNPNIGKHLHLHPVAMAWGHFPDDTDNNGWLGQDKRSYEGGIMTAMSTVVADFDKIGGGYGAIIQTPALHPGMFAALTPWTSGVDFRERMIKFSRTAHVFALARDEGSGEVKSMRTLRYKIDKRDEEKLKKGMEKLLRILVAAGAEEVGTQHYGGQRLKVKGASRDEVERFIKEERETGVRELARPVCSAHQMGSCRMGVNEKESVVDQRGETWEAEGLFVADSSVFPTALGVNPMVTVQAIAYCTAQSILETLNRKKQR